MDGETAYPVEYKRGKAKLDRADEVQLCAQALCLEEMTGRAVPEGALFYAEVRRRVSVQFDAGLRRLTEETASQFGALFAAGRTPPATYRTDRCRACSLIEVCRPRVSAKSALGFRARAIGVALQSDRSNLKRLLNTIYVTTEGASLRKDGENLVAEVDGLERARVPFHMISSVVVFGAIFVSPPLTQALASLGITVVLLDRSGKFQARIEGPVSGNVLLRRAQYRASERPDEIVRSIVSAKIANQRAVLQRALRDYGAEMATDRRERLDAVVDRLAQILRRVAFANDGTDVFRGAEGEAAQNYFSVFGDLIRRLIRKSDFRGVAGVRHLIPLMPCCRFSIPS